MANTLNCLISNHRINSWIPFVSDDYQHKLSLTRHIHLETRQSVSDSTREALFGM
uniref:Uncharacterized protein n=1 Tax=Arundo donax TaxID=35708 RepID=A0A0A9E473_ARUDO